MQLMLIFFTGIVIDNVILTKFLGLCSFFGVTKDRKTSLGMSAAVVIITTLSTVITFSIYHGLLLPNNLGYMQIIIYVLVIAGFVQLCEILLKRFVPALYKALGVYLPLITTNCAVLGVAMLVIDRDYGFFESVFYSLGAGVGYLAAMMIFAGIRERIDEDAVPKSFRGIPIILICAGIMACSFVGFGGIIENIFAGK
jgi:electron transport complex, RnfABCDGE type, A subunit